MSLRERALSCKTLVCLLQSIQGMRTTVELRNESSIEGVISKVDGYMNIEMTDATFITASKLESYNFEYFFVQGKKIRYVHIPDEVDMVKSMEEQLKMLQR
ncbi:LSM10 (predicted) [Pycnogonum litorale]